MEFRRRTLLPLDDVMGCLLESIPKLSRSGLHRLKFRDDMGKMNGADFLRGVIKAFSYKIHTVLTDNGMAFADLPKNRDKPIHAFLGMHIFGRVCNENGIAHKLTKPYYPWTNGQAERMDWTIRKTSIKVSAQRTHVDIGQPSAVVNVRRAEPASDEAGVQQSGGFCVWADAAAHLSSRHTGRAH